MPKLPVLKPREVVRLLEKLGFNEARQRGSHKQFRHADGRSTTVPFHPGRDISPVLLRVIARDIGITVEALLGVSDTSGHEVNPENGVKESSEEREDVP